MSGAKIAGRPVSLYFGCSDATPDVAVAEARRLVESDKVNILVGPLSGDEGIAVANYAKTQPQVTFINGTSGAQATTLSVHAPNFFRFGGDGAQWMAGLGSYAYKTLHWRTAAILGEDYSYPYTQAAGVRQRVLRPRRSGHQAHLGAADDHGLVVLRGAAPQRRRRLRAAHRRHRHGRHPQGLPRLRRADQGPRAGRLLGLDPTSFALGSQLAGLAGGSPVPLGGTSAQWTSYVKRFLVRV